MALLVALLLGYGGASVFARRIRRLERAAERIATGSSTSRWSTGATTSSASSRGPSTACASGSRSSTTRAREFIANASHELRTPLFSLGGFLELLDDEELDDATRTEFVARCASQVERLTKLATDLLDLSRLDAGRLRIELEHVELANGRGRSSTSSRPRTRRAATRSTRRRRRAAGARRRGARAPDRPRAGRERAQCTRRPARACASACDERDGRAVLAVEDDGPGHPAEHAPHVFERFYRVDGRLASGSGLGLAIARELAEVMGGRVTLESRPGRTVFALAAARGGGLERRAREPALA